MKKEGHGYRAILSFQLVLILVLSAGAKPLKGKTKVSVHIPNEGDQRRIASMLYSLDLRVAHEERQVKALTDVKAAFLQQLFI